MKRILLTSFCIVPFSLQTSEKIDTMEFGRRMTVERELDNLDNPSNVIFDESGNFVLYPTMLGIKCMAC